MLVSRSVNTDWPPPPLNFIQSVSSSLECTVLWNKYTPENYKNYKNSIFINMVFTDTSSLIVQRIYQWLILIQDFTHERWLNENIVKMSYNTVAMIFQTFFFQIYLLALSTRCNIERLIITRVKEYIGILIRSEMYGKPNQPQPGNHVLL